MNLPFQPHQIPLLRHPLSRCPLRLQSQQRLCLRPSPRLFSSRFLRCWWPFGRTERQTQTSSSTSGNSSAAPFATRVPSYTSTLTACRSSSSAGSVTVPSFLSTYSSVGIPMVSHASQPPVLALSAPSLFDHSLVALTSSPTLAPSVGKAFVVGSGYAQIPGKLVAKITSGAFIELADLLAENIRTQEAEPHSYLDGNLLVAPAKKRVVEINNILTWIQAFTIYKWIFCSTYPSRWQDTTQYKLLILQTASQFSGPAWLNYDGFQEGCCR